MDDFHKNRAILDKGFNKRDGKEIDQILGEEITLSIERQMHLTDLKEEAILTANYLRFGIEVYTKLGREKFKEIFIFASEEAKKLKNETKNV